MQSAKRVLSPSKADNVNAICKKYKPQLNLDVQKETTSEPQDQENYGFLLDDDNDFDLCALDAAVTASKLDLTRWQRCVVKSVERLPKTYNLLLHLNSADSAAEDPPATADCQLQAPWHMTPIEPGDVVSVQAQWQPSLSSYVVNKESGYCVIQPDMLISSTTVTGSLFCRRKAVLQDRFRGVDGANAVMIVGTLVHELLQTVLAQRLRSHQQVLAALQQLLESTSLAQLLYGSQLSQAEIELQLHKFVEPIVAFVAQYIDGVQSTATLPPEMYKDRIEEIHDIEENLWVPQLGLKGKVDVSVRVRRQKQPIPLELKTGRASFSMEHKGQLLLYQLMHTALGQDTHSGLLLYLREGIMREVRDGRNEQRDLVLLRNELAHFLSREVQLPVMGEALSVSPEQPGKLLQPFQLPEPISHHSACGNCAYATLCCSFASTDAQLELSDTHPLRRQMEQQLAHLTLPDHEYVLHWCGLLALEEQQQRQGSQLRSLWTETAMRRQQQGRAICELQLAADQKIKSSGSCHNGRYEQQLHLSAQSELNLTLSGFELGEYVTVSCSSRQRLAIAAGYIMALMPRSITLQLERDLSQRYAGETFVVDKHESQSFVSFNYTNLALLLEDNERAAELRSIVVAKQPPTQHKLLPRIIGSQGGPMLRPLNKVQQAAALRALTTSTHLLIKGLPGTGKTQTLVAIVRLLHLMQRSVLITAQTHSAVDNLLLRLLPHKLPLLRLGSSQRIHPQLQEISEAHLTADCHTLEELTAALQRPSIVGVTCLGAGHALFQQRRFDYCIVDEATQVLQPTVLRALSHCSKFILVGDPEQLPPLVRSREARSRGADETLFQRLDCEQATAVLTLQYRMNRSITRLANQLTYGEALQCADEQVANAKLQLQPLKREAGLWTQRALQTHLEQAVLLLDTGDCSQRCQQFSERSQQLEATSASIELSYGEAASAPAPTSSSPKRARRAPKYTNYCEAAIVLHLLRQLLDAGFEPSRIGVIAPYRAQVELLRKLSPRLIDVEFNTVDQYQGRDKDLIIYSCSKTGPMATGQDMERSREAEILEDQRRLTVAITRAKHKLLLLGDAKCLERYGPFKRLFEHIPERCRVQLTEGRMGFSWQTLLDGLAQLLQ
ncbi:DNA replication ATP-dependent helicase/nuclease DNA2 [Drosophila albomicans]|uniref:DNA replication ATP-dependent helicase/nuclease n=1 Tax=Drosophila albomicans TaxID=7291 RepID=A0A6P8XYQ0_DROAB|nr:DNA replication ATP-dependent helicase/nuclease DNA2 [Drosophila albomicans]